MVIKKVNEEETVMVAYDDCIKVEFVNIGEGYWGDYNPENPDDVNLLRFYVYFKPENEKEWQAVEDASYCTGVAATEKEETIMEKIGKLFKAYRKAYGHICRGGSVKKLGEAMSWI